MDDSTSPHFGCFTLQTPSSPGMVFVTSDGSDGQSVRKRKAHTKSRSGCRNCKVRKIKCDEGNPCLNCLKRNQECNTPVCPKLPPSALRIRRPIQEIASSPSVIPDTPSSLINLEHMRLLHHFQTSTFETFVIDPRVWRDTVIDLALQNNYLMHVAFVVTATHLHHLQPHETRHKVAALQHLSQALPLFRKTLAETSDFKGPHGQALVACSMLLLQYSWTPDSDGWGSVVGLYKGLRDLSIEFIETLNFHSRSDWERTRDRFISLLAYSPRQHIEEHIKDTPIPSTIQEVFAHILTCTNISDTQPEDPNDFIGPSKRLMTILSVLQLSRQDLEKSGLMLDVARYLFSFPVLLPVGFVNVLKKEDWRAQVIVLYYFAAVSRLNPKRYWWMQEKALFMYKMVLRNIGDKCTECTRHATEIYER